MAGEPAGTPAARGASEIGTCVQSLLVPGACCTDGCPAAATVAILDADLVEHARCDLHTSGAVATKPLRISPLWLS